MTSHAAVVARGMGKPAVTGCKALKVDLWRRVLMLGDQSFETSDVLTS